MGKVDEGGWESSLGLVSADHCGDPVRILCTCTVLVPYMYLYVPYVLCACSIQSTSYSACTSTCTLTYSLYRVTTRDSKWYKYM